MDILFFCPAREKANAEKFLAILQGVAADGARPNVVSLDENSPAGWAENKKYAAVLIFYTDEVGLSDRLFEVVRYIEREKPLGRFIFLPKSGGKQVIPPIFHPIRALQLQLFYYSSGETLEAGIEAFNRDWHQFASPAGGQPSGKPGQGRRSRQAGFGLIVFASILILFLVGFLAQIVPIARKTVLNLTPSAIRPPEAAAFWLEDAFQAGEPGTLWQEEHYYTGKQALETEFRGTGLHFSAQPVVTEAVYRLDSLGSWPLDDLQSLSFTFALSSMEDPAAQMVVGIALVEEEAYRLDCLVLPEKTAGKIQCQIHSPNNSEAISDAVPLSLDQPHTANLVFDPQTYSIKFFLDDQYHGEREFKDVPYWRDRSFDLHIQVQLQNMTSGSFSCDLQGLQLAHRP